MYNVNEEKLLNDLEKMKEFFERLGLKVVLNDNEEPVSTTPTKQKMKTVNINTVKKLCEVLKVEPKVSSDGQWLLSKDSSDVLVIIHAESGNCLAYFNATDYKTPERQAELLALLSTMGFDLTMKVEVKPRPYITTNELSYVSCLTKTIIGLYKDDKGEVFLMDNANESLLPIYGVSYEFKGLHQGANLFEEMEVK